MFKMRPMTIMMTCAALSACGGSDEAPGLKKSDLTKVPPAIAAKIDVRTIETRRINGVWKGRIDKTDIEAQFGGDGTLSLQQLENGSIMDDARGTYAWTSDGHLKGTLEGASAGLKSYSTWDAGFADAGTMIVSGRSGTIRLARRRGYAPEPVGDQK